ncbi:Adenylate cyclase [uncultured Candidatus Thioglobus sp.]|nr:Adenylate cyclase [uncultured Candidatus Thioglobus sp.]
MCTFPTAEDAGNAAWDIQETFEQKAETNTDGSPISIRIGMHLGPAILEDDGDINGDAVNIAARMATQAKSKQIITTQDTLGKLPLAMQTSSRFVDHAPIKGKKEEIDIFEIIWQEEDITSMATGVIINKPTPKAILRVTYNGKSVEIDKNQPSLVMGRSQNCDLMINEKLASRQHVRIELRRDKFFIVDQSTNGTHIMLGDNPEEFLRREESPINSDGRISLGKKFSENPEQVVDFILIT